MLWLTKVFRFRHFPLEIEILPSGISNSFSFCVHFPCSELTHQILMCLDCFLISSICQQINSSIPVEATCLQRQVDFTTLLKSSGIYCIQAYLLVCQLPEKICPFILKCHKTAKKNTRCFLFDVLYCAWFYQTACKLLSHKVHHIKIATLKKQLWQMSVWKQAQSAARKWSCGTTPLLSPFSNLHQPNIFVLNEARFCTDFLKSQSPAQCA